jgi:hypothetical protein
MMTRFENNLNQIAKIVNYTNGIYHKDIEEIKEMMKEL